MKFTLTLNIPKSGRSIHHGQDLLCLGSCFADSIGEQLRKGGFKTLVNPFGVMFNPISLVDLFHVKSYSEEDLFEHQNHYFSLNHHGRFSSSNKTALLDELNTVSEQFHERLHNTDVVVFTLGTAWVYELISDQKIVANCHKLPQKFFRKRMLSVDEIVNAYQPLIQNTLKGKHVIFTVSPVRHWKDGAVENSRSKATLHLAIGALQEQFPTVDYFPSYEIVTDELRDYRFFKEDMLHPNTQAIEYVWKKFQDVYFGDESKKLLKEVEEYQRLKAHRPINRQEDAVKNHEQKLKQSLEELQKDLPHLT